jgi:hypothetical protein
MSTNLRLTSAALCGATQQRCDPIGARCMLPLPNDHFTVADASTPTQRRLAIDSVSLPANRAGVHIDVTDQNRADGWSPGSAMMVEIPGLDAVKSRLPGLVDAKRSLDPGSPIVVLDATSGKRIRSGRSSTRTRIPAPCRCCSSTLRSTSPMGTGSWSADRDGSDEHDHDSRRERAEYATRTCSMHGHSLRLRIRRAHRSVAPSICSRRMSA